MSKFFESILLILILTFYSFLLIKVLKQSSQYVTIKTFFTFLGTFLLTIILFSIVEMSYAP
jgi:hypothetical protein